jgi:nitrite reductase/ring-hydroxylating ferredoxin subunit
MTPDGGYIRCLSHGAKFEPDTGACVAGPCPGQYLQRLECHEDSGIIRVRAPASARDL